MRRLIVALLLPGIGACGDSVDQFEEVEDRRGLAIRAAPPEYLIPTDQGFAPESLEFEVSFDALVVNPRGEPLDVAWQFCPVESDDACRDYETERDRTPEFREDLDAMRALGQSESGVERIQGGARQDVPPYAIAPFVVEVPSTLAPYHLADNFFGIGAGSLPSVQLRVTTATDTILANKRFVLNVDDVGTLSDVFEEEFDFQVCAPDEDPASGCVELAPAEQHTTPVFERLESAFSDQANAPFSEIPRLADGSFEPPRLAPFEQVRINPVFTEESSQKYQLLQTNIDTQEIQVLNRQEEISVAWFISGGAIQDELTWPPFTRTLDTVFEAPGGLPPGEQVSVWLIAQDQRGGSSWVQLEMIIE